MNLLPKAAGSRPCLACEIAVGGVVAARSPEPGAPLAATARIPLAEGAILPSLKPGNIADRIAVIAAVRRALEQAGARPNTRGADLTLVLPDAAVRVLLLEFDTLPNKLSEALPLVRFRLKKLVPFDPDDAMVSFQIMSTSRAMVRVLAVAVPRDVLAEYESVVREAGFEPGAVLPSTLAALAALDEGEGASLVVNAHETGITTAIVRAGIVLLHRSVELTEHPSPLPANLPPALFDANAGTDTLLPLVDREDTASEWAAQEPLPEYGRNPYADTISAETAVEDEDGITGLPVPHAFNQPAYPRTAAGTGHARYADPAAPAHSPYAASTTQAELDASSHQSILVAPTSFGELTSPEAATSLHQLVDFAHQRGSGPEESSPPVHILAPDAKAEEIARAVSVAVAYFEDSLGAAPELLLSAGSLGAEGLNRTLREQGVAQTDGLRVRELIDPAVLAAGAVSAGTPRGWLTGVVGALRS